MVGLIYVGVGDEPIRQPAHGFLLAPIQTYGLSVTVFELISWLQKRFRPSARPFDPDTTANTGLEATASLSDKNFKRLLTCNKKLVVLPCLFPAHYVGLRDRKSIENWQTDENKVIATMVIRPHDDLT